MTSIDVRRVRCRSRSPGARRRVLDALDRLDADTGLAHSAILVVRHLDGSVTGAPARIVGVDLRDLARRAHPASAGPIPADCTAVVFGDEAELLASLAADLAAGRPLGWWWTALLRRGTPTTGAAPGLPPAAAAAVAFERFARAVPAAAAGSLPPVLAAAGLLSPAQAIRTLSLMAQAHAAVALVTVAHHASWRVGTSPSTGPSPTIALGHPAAGAGSRRPIRSGGPEAGPPGTMAHRPPSVAAVLVEAAVRLHRDPVGARSPAMAEAVSSALAVALGATAGEPAVVSGAASAPPRPLVAAPSPPAPHPKPATSRDPATATATATATAEPIPDAAVPVTPRHDSDPHVDHEALGELRRFATALGGAFYLLHLLDRLGLPTPSDGGAETAVNRWGLLALALRAWPEIDPGDALFDLLDELAGPPAQEPPADDADGRRLVELLGHHLDRLQLDEGVVAVAATVEVTALTIRVRMGLESIDLRVRRAGLDRDPGWVPELGRMIELEFV